MSLDLTPLGQSNSKSRDLLNKLTWENLENVSDADPKQRSRKDT